MIFDLIDYTQLSLERELSLGCVDIKSSENNNDVRIYEIIVITTNYTLIVKTQQA